MRNILNRILRPKKSTTTLSARILLNVILHTSKFQSLEKYYRFKNEYSFLGEGKNFTWEDSETNILLKQIFCLQGRAVILLISLPNTWDSAWMGIILRGEQYFFSEEYLINWFLAKELEIPQNKIFRALKSQSCKRPFFDLLRHRKFQMLNSPVLVSHRMQQKMFCILKVCDI